MATPFMGLSLPTVSSTVGPTWATELNTALTLVDSHNHATGSGNRVPTAGLNINADLALANYNATLVRSARFYDQGSALVLATDLGCLYIAGGNLYYNNGSGTAIQITAGSSLNAASIGGIGGDYSTSTASEFYTAGNSTFSLTSASSKAATLDCGSVIVREPNVALAKGITLRSPVSLSASYNLTFPSSLPGSTMPLQLSSAGAVATGQIATEQIADSAVTNAKIGSGAVAYANLASDAKAGSALGVASYNASGTRLATAGQLSFPASISADSSGWSIAIGSITSSAIVIATPWGVEGATSGSVCVAYVSSTGTLRVYAKNGSQLLGISVSIFKL